MLYRSNGAVATGVGASPDKMDRGGKEVERELLLSHNCCNQVHLVSLRGDPLFGYARVILDGLGCLRSAL